MKRYQQGILLGVVLGALLAVAIALATSEERRHQLSHRLEVFRNALPDGEQLKQSAQQAATKAREAGSNLGHRTQEMASVAQETATSFAATLQAKGSDLANGLRDRQ